MAKLYWRVKRNGKWTFIAAEMVAFGRWGFTLINPDTGDTTNFEVEEEE